MPQPSSSENDHSLMDDLFLMQHAAKLAGSAIMNYYRPGKILSSKANVREKSKDNPLTNADTEADTLLKKTLLSERSDYGWLSEETSDNPKRLACHRVWVVDPIDGTKEFITGLPQFAVSIGLVEKDQPILACVYNPATDELFSAFKGGGTQLNGKPVTVSQRTDLQGASCLASRSETKRGEWDSFKSELVITTMGSIAYKLAMVASGRYDISFTLTPKNEWDYCAGMLLIQEAGGSVSHKGGERCRFNQHSPRITSVLATNGHLHSELLTRLKNTPLSADRHAIL